MKRYEKLVRNICRVDWQHEDVSLFEKEGAIGVACVAAYLGGVKANAEDLSRHLDLPQSQVEVPFRRLLTNGAFTKNDARQDSALTDDKTFHETRRAAWCYIAGIAGGLAGLREDS